MNRNQTKFQIKQKILEQLNLTLNWSKEAMDDLAGDDLEELRKIRFMLKGLMKDIDTGTFEVKQK